MNTNNDILLQSDEQLLSSLFEVTQLRKRDGRIIRFVPEKITSAVYKAARSAAAKMGTVADFEKAEYITEVAIFNINKQFANSIPSVEDIQDIVIKSIEEANEFATAKEYINYRSERTKVRENNTNLMKTIDALTSKDADENDAKRENANVDGNTSMGTMLQYGSTVAKEFAKAHLLRPEHTSAHESGDIHIHDMDFLSIGTLTCCQIDLIKLFKNGFSTGHGFLREPNDIMSYAALAAIAVQSNQNDQHGGQSIPTLDYGLAPGVQKSYVKAIIVNMAKAFELLFDTEETKANELAKAIVAEVTVNEELRMESSDQLWSNVIALIASKLNVSNEDATKAFNFTRKEALKETKKKTYQAMEAFIHNLNTMHSRAGAQVPFSSVNFGTDTTAEGRMVTENLLLATEAGLGNGETPIFPILVFKVKDGVSYKDGDRNYDLFKLACRVSAKRLFPNFAFIDAPFNLQYYREGRPETEVTYMGCRTRVIGNSFDKEKEVVTGRGNLSFTTINLPRLGIKHGIINNSSANIAEFFYELERKMDMVVTQLNDRYDIQKNKKVKNFPFLMGQGVWEGSDKLGPNDKIEEVIKHGTLTVGFIGLAECLVALTGKHHGESEESQKLGLEIIKFMREKMDTLAAQTGLNYSLIATPAEGLAGRFTKIDRKTYGEIPGITDREYYTNSFHVPVYHEISAFDKIDKEAPYHGLTNAGHITYVELDGTPTKNLEAFETIIRAMKESGIGYGSVNHPVDRDPVCGFTGLIHNECPKCGRTEQDGPRFDRIRRITGYLVGTVDRFNNGKQAEERDRVKHSVRPNGNQTCQ